MHPESKKLLYKGFKEILGKESKTLQEKILQSQLSLLYSTNSLKPINPAGFTTTWKLLEKKGPFFVIMTCTKTGFEGNVTLGGFV